VFLSPAEIKQQQLREKRGAYEREDVDALIDNVIGSYQHV
jgi:DivIVA domain-containing protein